MTTQKGLICNIYKPEDGDCSNGGISSRCNSVTLIGIGADIFDVQEDRPAVRIVKRDLGGKYGEYMHAEPVEQPVGMNGPMFGGCYIRGDSRTPGAYPIPLHDRFEAWERN